MANWKTVKRLSSQLLKIRQNLHKCTIPAVDHLMNSSLLLSSLKTEPRLSFFVGIVKLLLYFALETSSFFHQDLHQLLFFDDHLYFGSVESCELEKPIIDTNGSFLCLYLVSENTGSKEWQKRKEELRTLFPKSHCIYQHFGMT